MKQVKAFLKDTSGATVLEYSLISFLVSLATLAAIIALEVNLMLLFPS
ncbi:MAG: Flp family type IVb pilin [Pseudomonadota bacterium]|nr:Flp family type IVb pilin [Pseudomonadota bacterium]